jgi:hypothetical protein
MVLVGEPEVETHLGNLGLEEKVILKWILK